MDEDPAAFFRTIQNSIFGRLTAQVMLYRQLFEDQTTAQMLRSSHAAGALGVLERMLMEAVVIGLGRLLDAAAGSGERENLSLKALERRLCHAGETDLAKLISDWFRQHRSSIKRVQAVRNRFIGHLDARTYLGQDQLPEVGYDDVLALFDEVNGLMNQLGAELTGATTDYGWLGMPQGDGHALINLVDKAHKYLNLMAEIERGALSRDTVLSQILRDFDWPDTARLVERGDMRSHPHW